MDDTTQTIDFGWMNGNAGSGVWTETAPSDPNTTTIQFPWLVPGFTPPPSQQPQYQPPAAKTQTWQQWATTHSGELLAGAGALFLVAMLLGGKRR